jgi:ABC-2 type transport system ATP-binding protein
VSAQEHPQTDPVIRTRGLTKYYGPKTVVDRLDLAVPVGAVFALLGDNGAGKSTTIRMLTGALPADGGRAEVLGQDCWTAAPALRLRVGYVPEKPRFYDWMTVAEIGWFSAGFHRPGYLTRYLDLAARFRLDRTSRLSSLSKGGYAKVGLALALAADPEVLILDEPTSGLDLFTRREFLTSMVELAGEGRTILISSHGVAEVERVASHVAFLAEGRLLLAAPLEELRTRIVRVRLRFQKAPPDGGGLGQVLDQETSGRLWQAVLQDPDRAALEALHLRDDVFDVEETPLTLEEIYTALLARYHKTPAPGAAANGLAPDKPEPLAAGAAARAEEGGRP